MNVVVLGSGAIGLAFVQSVLSHTIFAQSNVRCIATWHKTKPQWQHPQLTWRQLEATDPESMQKFALEVAREVGAVDWLVNTIGFLHNLSDENCQPQGPEKRIAEFNPDFWLKCMSINVTPTLLGAKYFSKYMRKNAPTVFATVSAKVGSIEDNRLGGWYSYRASKAALNMVLKTLSLEWRYLLPHSCVAALHPGTTDSDLSAPFSANVRPEKLFTPSYAAECMIRNIRKMNAAQTGQFWSWDGSIIPW